MPKSVLKTLCSWKAWCRGELCDICERCYIFRTDINGGNSVAAKDCTNKFQRLYCTTCEKKLRKEDNEAADLWKELVSSWQQREDEEGGPISPCRSRIRYELKEDEENKRITYALFSMLQRTLHLERYQGFDASRLTMLRYDLPPDKCRTYRVEFPLFCDVQLGGLKINTVCAQVPPFFCVLLDQPFADILEPYLSRISTKLHAELNSELHKFLKQPEQATFREWYETHHSSGPGPLLVFDYLHESDIKVNIVADKEDIQEPI